MKHTRLALLLLPVLLIGCLAALCSCGDGTTVTDPVLTGTSVTSGTETTNPGSGSETTEPAVTTPAETQAPHVPVSPDAEEGTIVHVNQIGYLPGHTKRAVVVGGGREFWVVNADTGAVAYTGQVEKGSDGVDPLSGDVVCYADFTEFDEPGRYYIYLENNGVTSYPFMIGEDALDGISKATLKAFYYQRCSFELTEEFAGELAHPACHMYTSPYFTNQSESRDIHGGWHDAGDCGCYATAIGPVMHIMMTEYELFPNAPACQDANNIPESGNGIPDILDEVKVGLDWYFSMQDTDGGVYHSRGNNGPAALGPLATDTTIYYIWPKTMEATCNFITAMEHASRVYEPIDADYAADCAAAAIRAGEWIKENWNMVSFDQMVFEGSKWGANPYMGYDLSDEKMAACCSLYILTGEQDWHQRYMDLCSTVTDSGSLNYNYFTFFTTYTYLTAQGVEKDERLVRTLERRLEKVEEKFRTAYESTAYRADFLGSGSFGWGSNISMFNNLTVLILCDQYFGRSENEEIVVESADYVLGKNAVNYCFVTGYGSQPISHMHHKITFGNDIVLPGYMVSGPVRFEVSVISHKNLADEGLSKDTPPMKCFIDKWDYYRFTESDLFRLAGSSFIFGYLTNLNR